MTFKRGLLEMLQPLACGSAGVFKFFFNFLSVFSRGFFACSS